MAAGSMRAFRIAYDGTPYHGFQRQPDAATVEGVLFDALRELEVLADGASKPAAYAAAGRTDAGVSALAQTVAFRAPDWLTPRALNGALPADVRAWARADVPGDFHATRDARVREYAYYLYAPRTRMEGGGRAASDDDRRGASERDGRRGASERDGRRTSSQGDDRRAASEGVDPRAAFDDDSAREALARLAGEHDFHNLTPDETGTVRDLDAGAEREGAFLVVRLRAGGFPRQLVRRVVGLVESVGRGDAPLEVVDRALAEEPLSGPDGVAPAPPEPLVLEDVDYDRPFVVDGTAAASARGAFGRRHAERLTGARVAGAIRDGIEE